MDSGSTAHTFDSPKSYFRKAYFEVLDTAGGELKRRFQQERGMPVAAVLEKMLLDASQISFDDPGALPSELEMYSKDIDRHRLFAQLNMLPDLIGTYNERNPATAIKQVTNLRTLCEIMNDVTSSKIMFREVFYLLRILLTIPVTTSTAERTFSSLRRLKNFLRSTMSQPRLNHIILLHIHKDKTDNLDMLHIAKEFISVNDRRKLHFGSF